MKNKQLLFYIILSLILITIVISYIDIKTIQSNYHRKSLFQQLSIVSNDIENEGLKLFNDINNLLYNENIDEAFWDDNRFAISSKLQVIYSKYSNLIANIAVYDNNQNVLSIYKDKNDNFITDLYQLQWQKKLHDKEQFIYENENATYTFVDFNKVNNTIVNITITIDIKHYIENKISKYFIDKIIDQNIYNINKQKFLSYSKKQVIDSTLINYASVDHHGVLDREDDQCILYFPIHFLNEDLTVFFSVSESKYYNLINYRLIIYLTIFILLIIIVIKVKITQYKIYKKQLDINANAHKSFTRIMELMPIGIIILNDFKRIELINRSAKKMLFIDEDEDIVGSDISHRFFLGKSLNISTDYMPAYDSNHFFQYEKDGKEVFIYKKDIPTVIDNKDFVIQSFLDVTSIEKSRKREISANMAKSEFLARMSHEIRTPMNGIIGMADSINTKNFNQEQLEQITIIRRSADMLLSIINDILDFSKIEAGKMILEEIPFKLRDEINLSVELFKPLTQEKNLKILTEIDDAVDNNYIGDPFRIRQILNNLISNAVKFTHEGKIVVGVKKIEEYNRVISLKFSVEDTGIGIPKEKIGTIFNSFTQADHSTTRKYGGTGLGTSISKQLVELMNGEISVQSPSDLSDDPKNPGTSFSFIIDLYSNEKTKKNVENNLVDSFKSVKVLIIGENKIEEKNIEETLKYFGIQVDQQQYTKSTIDFLKLNSESVFESRYNFLIIKDSAQFDGFKVLNQILDARLTNLFNILLISSNDKNGNYAKSKRLGVDYYLVLPFESSELYNIISDSFVEIDYVTETQKPTFTQISKELKILVAEDNLINQKVARTIFKNIGYDIDIAKDGKEAVDMANSIKYDIIFMDVMMPVMDGHQSTIELRNQGFSLPIIAMTANANKEDKMSAISIGMSDYIIKPVKIDSIKKILIKYFS